MLARILGPADFKAMPWKNGRGTTTELAREDSFGTMLWWVSSADVIEAGEFSLFPGVDRILMLTEGQGFDLDFGAHGEVAPVEPLVPVRFSGDWTTRAENLRGPSRDLNVMVARDRATADVAIHRDGGPLGPHADRSLFLVLAGHFALTIGAEAFALRQSELLVVSGAEGLVGTASGAGLVLSIEITLRR
jgi:uncharacterized protein